MGGKAKWRKVKKVVGPTPQGLQAPAKQHFKKERTKTRDAKRRKMGDAGEEDDDEADATATEGSKKDSKQGKDTLTKALSKKKGQESSKVQSEVPPKSKVQTNDEEIAGKEDSKCPKTTEISVAEVSEVVQESNGIEEPVVIQTPQVMVTDLDKDLDSPVIEGLQKPTSEEILKEELRKATEEECPQVEESKLNGTQVEESKLNGTQVEESKLNGTQVEESKLNGTQVEESKLNGTQVEESKLNGTKVEESKLNGTQVEESKLNGTQVEESKPNDATNDVETCAKLSPEVKPTQKSTQTDTININDVEKPVKFFISDDSDSDTAIFVDAHQATSNGENGQIQQEIVSTSPPKADEGIEISAVIDVKGESTVEVTFEGQDIEFGIEDASEPLDEVSENIDQTAEITNNESPVVTQLIDVEQSESPKTSTVKKAKYLPSLAQPVKTEMQKISANIRRPHAATKFPFDHLVEGDNISKSSASDSVDTVSVTRSSVSDLADPDNISKTSTNESADPDAPRKISTSDSVDLDTQSVTSTNESIEHEAISKVSVTESAEQETMTLSTADSIDADGTSKMSTVESVEPGTISKSSTRGSIDQASESCDPDVISKTSASESGEPEYQSKTSYSEYEEAEGITRTSVSEYGEADSMSRTTVSESGDPDGASRTSVSDSVDETSKTSMTATGSSVSATGEYMTSKSSVSYSSEFDAESLSSTADLLTPKEEISLASDVKATPGLGESPKLEKESPTDLPDSTEITTGRPGSPSWEELNIADHAQLTEEGGVSEDAPPKGDKEGTDADAESVFFSLYPEYQPGEVDESQDAAMKITEGNPKVLCFRGQTPEQGENQEEIYMATEKRGDSGSKDPRNKGTVSGKIHKLQRKLSQQKKLEREDKEITEHEGSAAQQSGSSGSEQQDTTEQESQGSSNQGGSEPSPDHTGGKSLSDVPSSSTPSSVTSATDAKKTEYTISKKTDDLVCLPGQLGEQVENLIEATEIVAEVVIDTVQNEMRSSEIEESVNSGAEVGQEALEVENKLEGNAKDRKTLVGKARDWIKGVTRMGGKKEDTNDKVNGKSDVGDRPKDTKKSEAEVKSDLETKKSTDGAKPSLVDETEKNQGAEVEGILNKTKEQESTEKEKEESATSVKEEITEEEIKKDADEQNELSDSPTDKDDGTSIYDQAAEIKNSETDEMENIKNVGKDAETEALVEITESDDKEATIELKAVDKTGEVREEEADIEEKTVGEDVTVKESTEEEKAETEATKEVLVEEGEEHDSKEEELFNIISPEEELSDSVFKDDTGDENGKAKESDDTKVQEIKTDEVPETETEEVSSPNKADVEIPETEIEEISSPNKDVEIPKTETEEVSSPNKDVEIPETEIEEVSSPNKEDVGITEPVEESVSLSLSKQEDDVKEDTSKEEEKTKDTKDVSPDALSQVEVDKQENEETVSKESGSSYVSVQEGPEPEVIATPKEATVDAVPDEGLEKRRKTTKDELKPRRKRHEKSKSPSTYKESGKEESPKAPRKDKEGKSGKKRRHRRRTKSQEDGNEVQMAISQAADVDQSPQKLKPEDVALPADDFENEKEPLQEKSTEDDKDLIVKEEESTTEKKASETIKPQASEEEKNTTQEEIPSDVVSQEQDVKESQASSDQPVSTEKKKASVKSSKDKRHIKKSDEQLGAGSGESHVTEHKRRSRSRREKSLESKQEKHDVERSEKDTQKIIEKFEESPREKLQSGCEVQSSFTATAATWSPRVGRKDRKSSRKSSDHKKEGQSSDRPKVSKENKDETELSVSSKASSGICDDSVKMSPKPSKRVKSKKPELSLSITEPREDTPIPSQEQASVSSQPLLEALTYPEGVSKPYSPLPPGKELKFPTGVSKPISPLPVKKQVPVMIPKPIPAPLTLKPDAESAKPESPLKTLTFPEGIAKPISPLPKKVSQPIPKAVSSSLEVEKPLSYPAKPVSPLKMLHFPEGIPKPISPLPPKSQESAFKTLSSTPKVTSSVSDDQKSKKETASASLPSPKADSEEISKEELPPLKKTSPRIVIPKPEPTSSQTLEVSAEPSKSVSPLKVLKFPEGISTPASPNIQKSKQTLFKLESKSEKIDKPAPDSLKPTPDSTKIDLPMKEPAIPVSPLRKLTFPKEIETPASPAPTKVSKPLFKPIPISKGKPPALTIQKSSDGSLVKTTSAEPSKTCSETLTTLTFPEGVSKPISPMPQKTKFPSEIFKSTQAAAKSSSPSSVLHETIHAAEKPSSPASELIKSTKEVIKQPLIPSEFFKTIHPGEKPILIQAVRKSSSPAKELLKVSEPDSLKSSSPESSSLLKTFKFPEGVSKPVSPLPMKGKSLFGTSDTKSSGQPVAKSVQETTTVFSFLQTQKQDKTAEESSKPVLPASPTPQKGKGSESDPKLMLHHTKLSPVLPAPLKIKHTVDFPSDTFPCTKSSSPGFKTASSPGIKPTSPAPKISSPTVKIPSPEPKPVSPLQKSASPTTKVAPTVPKTVSPTPDAEVTPKSEASSSISQSQKSEPNYPKSILSGKLRSSLGFGETQSGSIKSSVKSFSPDRSLKTQLQSDRSTKIITETTKSTISQTHLTYSEVSKRFTPSPRPVDEISKEISATPPMTPPPEPEKRSSPSITASEKSNKTLTTTIQTSDVRSAARYSRGDASHPPAAENKIQPTSDTQQSTPEVIRPSPDVSRSRHEDSHSPKDGSQSPHAGDDSSSKKLRRRKKR